MSDLAIVVEERLATFAALGLQLWDPLSERPVADLRLVARRRHGRRTTAAYLTPSGVYAFRGLDGMVDVERPTSDDAVAAAMLPSAAEEFVVAAQDEHRRFLPMVLAVDVPHGGLVTAGDALASSLPNDVPIHLFSAPERVLPRNVAAVRARLVDTADAPVAFAVVDATVGGRRWVGVSDARGEVVVAFPWPVFGGAISGSPVPGTPGTPPSDQSWPVTVVVRSDRGLLDLVPGMPPLPHDPWPTLASLFQQAAKPIRANAGAPGVASVTRQLRFGRDLVVSTLDREDSVLVVEGVAP